MRVTIDGVAYVVTREQCQKAFELVEPNCVHARRLLASLTLARKPGTRPKYTAKQAATVRRMKENGDTVRAIAARVGLSVSCVQRICTKGEE